MESELLGRWLFEFVIFYQIAAIGTFALTAASSTNKNPDKGDYAIWIVTALLWPLFWLAFSITAIMDIIRYYKGKDK